MPSNTSDIPSTGVILALDIGAKRVGIAASDRDQRIAFPVSVLPAEEVRSHARTFRRVLEDYEPVALVAGLPRSMSGEENEQARRVRAFAEVVRRACGLPLVFADERLSSSQAKRIMREAGTSERAARGKVDKVAASLFLQAFLDGRRQG